jgi:hypothetical protein
MEMNSAADLPSSGAAAAKNDGGPTQSAVAVVAGPSTTTTSLSSLAAPSSASVRSDDGHQAAYHSLNSVNLTLLDPARWGWTAAGGVADLLPPHEVRLGRFQARGGCFRHALTSLLPRSRFLSPCSVLDEERPSATFSLPGASLRAAPTAPARGAMPPRRAAFGCWTAKVRRCSLKNNNRSPHRLLSP